MVARILWLASEEGHTTLPLVLRMGRRLGVDCPRQPAPGNAGTGGGAGPDGGAGPGPDGGAGPGGGATTTATATAATNNNPTSPASARGRKLFRRWSRYRPS